MGDQFYYVDKQLRKLEGKEKQELQKKIDEIDWSILDAVERRETITERGVFAPLDAVEVDEIAARADEFKKTGLEAIRAGKIGAVLLAGGQGTRLGYDQPKGTVNIGIEHDIYIFECLMKNLMKVTDEAGVPVPLYIMTSVSNNRDTIEFLEEHK